MITKYGLVNNYRDIIIDKIYKSKTISYNNIYFKIYRSEIYNVFDKNLLIDENLLENYINVFYEIKDKNNLYDTLEYSNINIAIKDIIQSIIS